VIEVPHVKGLSLSIDYWEIAQKNVIASGGGIAENPLRDGVAGVLRHYAAACHPTTRTH